MRPTTRNAHEFIAELKEFKTSGSLSAQFDSKGKYVVWSYNEPIAIWQKGFDWLITNEKFSVTTSRHTSQARLGAHYQGDSIKEVDHKTLRDAVFLDRMEKVLEQFSA